MGERDAIDARTRQLEERLIGPSGPWELVAGPGGSPRFRSGPSRLGDLYARASRMGDRTLLVHGCQRHSYGEIFTAAASLAARLRSDGAQGQRTALLLDDGPDWLIWFVALTSAGASCVLLPPAASRDLALQCLDAARCRSIVARQEIGAGFPGIRNLLDGDIGGDCASEGGAVEPGDEALVAFTSGSSGSPKGVVHTHRSLVSGHRNMMLAGALANQMLPAREAGSPTGRPPAAATLMLAPLAYVAGYSGFLLAAASGGRLVLPAETSDVGQVARIIEEEGANALTGASADTIRRLIRLPDARVRLSSLRRIQLHGEGLRGTLVEEIEAALPDLQLFTGYGLTETAGTVASAPVALVRGTSGGCGRLLPSVELRVVDDAGTPLARGTTGNVELRGDMVMRGYLDAEQTSAALTDGGWFRTGDMGDLDEHGWLRIIDRRDARWSAGDSVFFGSQLEDAVRALPGVDDAALVLSPDRRLLSLFVQGGAALSQMAIARALDDACGWTGELEVTRVARLPRTVSGKIDRRGLRGAV